METDGHDSADLQLPAWLLERSLPENSAEYMIFILDVDEEESQPQPQPQQPGSGHTRPRIRLEQLRKKALQLADTLTKNYIWQRDAFTLELTSRKGLHYLHGVTDYGDCVEDEWLIVYILREISKAYAGVWARICDSDGEFLLVEAAQAVPDWLSPEMDANRVWIHNGRLRVVPVASQAATASSPSSSAPSLSLAEAVHAIETAPRTLFHDAALEKEAFYRLQKYPAYIDASLHHARVLLPRKAAYILHDRPRAIAPAAEAFFLRDAASVKKALAYPSQGPGAVTAAAPFPPDDLVVVSVRFTRVLFARLQSERFEPPLPWARAFVAQAQALAEKEENAALSGDKARLQAMLELGIKVTCGLALMAATAETSNRRVVREVGLVLGDLAEDGQDMASVLPDAEIRSWADVDREDDDAWLHIDFSEFGRMLDGEGRRRSRTAGPPASPPSSSSSNNNPGPGQASSSFGDSGVETDLRKIVSRFQAFMEDESADVDGADPDAMDKDNDSDDDDDDDDTKDEEDDDSEDGNIDFDQEEFARLMREMMGLATTQEQPTKELATAAATARKASAPPDEQRVGQGNTDSKHIEDGNDDDDEQGILKLAAQFEAELKGHGALRIEPDAKQAKELLTRDRDADAAVEAESDDEGDVDVDYNLAKNILESFKSQGGMPGPAGNILSMLGLNLPRDADDDEKEDFKDKK